MSQVGDSKRRRTSRSAKAAELMQLLGGLGINIPQADIVYGELVGRPGELTSATIYVISGDKLLIYRSDLFDDNADKFNRAAKMLLSKTTQFDMLMADGVQAFISKNYTLIADEGCLIYDNYQITPSTDRLFELVVETIENRNVVVDEAADNNSKTANDSKLKRELADKENMANTSDMTQEKPTITDKPKQSLANNKVDKKLQSASHGDLIEQIEKVQQIARRVQKAGKLQPTDAMELILVLNDEITAELIGRLLGTKQTDNERVIDKLRRAGAIKLANERTPDVYRANITSLDELKDDKQLSVEGFRQAVNNHARQINGVTLIYDLDELSSVKVADEFIERLADFCQTTSDRAIRNYLSNVSETIKASEILQFISNDSGNSFKADALNTISYNEFHQAVTKYMILAGHVSDNPTAGYPWFIFNIPETDGLKIDILRYILVNREWIAVACGEQKLLGLISQLEELSVPADFQNAGKLKDYTIYSLRAMLTELKTTTVVDANQLSLLDVPQTKTKVKSQKQD